MKRALDIFLASVALGFLSPLLIVIAVWIKLDSPGPALFRQKRIGRHFRPFYICKFRTMIEDAARQGGPLTFGSDPRMTVPGRILRKTKLDEVPQLLNVLRGEMSFVGPRPEVPIYVDHFREEYKTILSVRPGMTDLASLKYRNEQDILGDFDNPEAAYIETILPDKIRLANEYVARSSLLLDLTIISKTLSAVVCDCNHGLHRAVTTAAPKEL
jgi:lipopolysaccharide/colanic/teichoic acid biosynthesis glycosyltransferase